MLKRVVPAQGSQARKVVITDDRYESVAAFRLQLDQKVQQAGDIRSVVDEVAERDEPVSTEFLVDRLEQASKLLEVTVEVGNCYGLNHSHACP